MTPRPRSTTAVPQGGRKTAWTAAVNGLLLGSLLALGAARSAAGQTAPAAEPVAQTGAVSQETFRARVRGELAGWRAKMRAFDSRADAAGHRTVDVAESGVRAAWDKTEAAGRGVDAASAEDWDKMKASYETASRDMAVAWQKAWH